MHLTSTGMICALDIVTPSSHFLSETEKVLLLSNGLYAAESDIPNPRGLYWWRSCACRSHRFIQNLNSTCDAVSEKQPETLSTPQCIADVHNRKEQVVIRNYCLDAFLRNKKSLFRITNVKRFICVCRDNPCHNTEKMKLLKI